MSPLEKILEELIGKYSESLIMSKYDKARIRQYTRKILALIPKDSEIISYDKFLENISDMNKDLKKVFIRANWGKISLSNARAEIYNQALADVRRAMEGKDGKV